MSTNTPQATLSWSHIKYKSTTSTRLCPPGPPLWTHCSCFLVPITSHPPRHMTWRVSSPQLESPPHFVLSVFHLLKSKVDFQLNSRNPNYNVLSTVVVTKLDYKTKLSENIFNFFPPCILILQCNTFALTLSCIHITCLDHMYPLITLSCPPALLGKLCQCLRTLSEDCWVWNLGSKASYLLMLLFCGIPMHLHLGTTDI